MDNKDQDFMEVLLVTHGEHQKRGDTAETYDGPLTEKGKRTINALRGDDPVSQLCEVAFRGLMQRQLETANLLCIRTGSTPTKHCGDDEAMFKMMEGDMEPANEFWQWLQDLKTQGYKKVLLVTSRAQAYIIMYFLGGGEKKFGTLMGFVNSIEAAAKWEGASIPQTQSGFLHRFQI